MITPLAGIPYLRILMAAVLLAGLTGCSAKINRRALHDPRDLASLDTLDGESPWLKVHLPDGHLYVLDRWTVDAERQVITGDGYHYDARRAFLDDGPQEIPLDRVALLESNVLASSGASGGLAALTILSLGVTAACIANPKACFGSCPTFYAPDAAGEPVLVAEGFSASVAPALEASDLDLLFATPASGGAFTLTMTNEALETHAVRRADLLAVPRSPGRRTAVDREGGWRELKTIIPLRRCLGPDGDATETVRRYDGVERTSLADSFYLGAKEHLVCEFDVPPEGELGLLVSSRHSLLSTYLFYQGLAYLGTNAAPMLARLEVDPGSAEGSEALGDLLGKIVIQVPDGGGSWRTVGEAGETGPLAVNTHLVPLPPLDPGDPRVRLEFTRGNWRIDQVALAVLGEHLEPVRVPPALVLREGAPDADALNDLLDDERLLVTLPGDHLEIVYHLPGGSDRWDLALESRGYYLEWMRTEWLAEEDPAAAALMFRFPELALRQLAPKFKELEPDMEAHFWGSRYANPTR